MSFPDFIHQSLIGVALCLSVAATAIDGRETRTSSSLPGAAQRVPLEGANIIRLELSGTVELHLGGEDWVEFAGTSSVHGFTLGSSNASTRPPYRAEALRRADTLIVRPAPRAPLRAVGLSWRHERFHHVVVAPRRAMIVVDGASALQIDGVATPQCARGAWHLGPDTPLTCVPEPSP
jgi:hypothetical protein